MTVLGCSGSYAAAGESCSGYLVRSETTALWVDCGPGTFANLQCHMQLQAIDALLVSHHHPDHCAELPVVYNAAKYYMGMEHIRVLATEGVREVTDAHGESSDLFGWEMVKDSSQARVGDIDVLFSRTDHPVETLAMRFESNGKSIVYTSDTGRGWALAALSRDVNRPAPDLVVGEGTLLAATDDPGIPHVSAAWLAADANDVGARQLVVTHVPPGSDPEDHLAEAGEVFSGDVAVARTGAVYFA